MKRHEAFKNHSLMKALVVSRLARSRSQSRSTVYSEEECSHWIHRDHTGGHTIV